MKYTKTQMETMLKLPDYLRLSYQTLLDLGGEASASQIAEHTSRKRAVESMRLNQLVLMGLLEKHRKGRIVYFKVVEDGKVKR